MNFLRGPGGTCLIYVICAIALVLSGLTIYFIFFWKG